MWTKVKAWMIGITPVKIGVAVRYAEDRGGAIGQNSTWPASMSKLLMHLVL